MRNIKPDKENCFSLSAKRAEALPLIGGKKTIRKWKTVLLLGTPGIGKSLFMAWLMWRIVSTRGADTDVSFRVTIRVSTNYFCTTQNDGSVEIIDAAKHGKANYYFSDSMDALDVNLADILILLVSSD